jgi:hypothetical protein
MSVRPAFGKPWQVVFYVIHRRLLFSCLNYLVVFSSPSLFLHGVGASAK